MKIVFLYNRIKTRSNAKDESSSSHWYGLKELQKSGINADFLEVEKVFPTKISGFFRKTLNIHLIHLPLLPYIFRYDVVISSSALGLLFLKSVLGFKRPKWIMLSFNLSHELSSRKGWKGFVYRKAAKAADGIVAISEAEADDLKKIYPNKRICFFPFGVDENAFKRDESVVVDKKFILSVGRDPGRDYATLLEAIKGVDADLYFTARPSQLKKNTVLPPNAHLVNFAQDDLIDAYARASLIVIPLNPQASSADSMGCSSLLESMSMGKITLVTDTRHMRSYINDGVNGIFFDQQNVEDLRKKINFVIGEPERFREIGTNARKSVVEKFSMTRFADNLRAFSEEIFRS